jgi:hypothetical protein
MEEIGEENTVLGKGVSIANEVDATGEVEEIGEEVIGIINLGGRADKTLPIEIAFSAA